MSGAVPTAGGRLNVLLVVPWDATRGGVVSVVDNLARHLRANGHRPLFFHSGPSLILKYRQTALGHDGAALRLTVPTGGGLRGLVRALLFPVLLLSTLLQLLWFLRRERIHVVNVHYPSDYFVYFAICRRLLPLRLVTSVHGRDAFYNERPLAKYSRAFRSIIDASDLVVLPSDAYRRKFIEGFPGAAGKTIYIHNGIDPANFAPDAAGEQAGRALKFILCVAELQEYKAIDVLLRAAVPALDADPSLTVVLAGHGPLRQELEALATTLGIRSRTLFLGTQGRAEIARLLRTCVLMVLPSRMEPFGIVLIEAMACGTPIVATNVGGIPEIVEHNVTGLLAQPDDVASLAAALQLALSDPALRRRMAQRGYDKVMERFCARHTGHAYLEAFASTLPLTPVTGQSPVANL